MKKKLGKKTKKNLKHNIFQLKVILLLDITNMNMKQLQKYPMTVILELQRKNIKKKNCKEKNTNDQKITLKIA